LGRLDHGYSMRHQETLITAIAANDLAKVAELLDDGADPNAKDEWGRPVLYFAIHPDVDPAMLRLLLARGASVPDAHWSGEPLLHAAARFSTPAIVGLLLDAGADPRTGALAATVLNDRADNARVLIRRGAEPDHTEHASGRTVLHAAFELGSRPVIDLLLAEGADPRRTDAAGDTVLHVMARVFVPSVHPPLVQLALRAGVGPHQENRAGKVATDLLAEPSHGRYFVPES
jgi:ankyrin repeat protein